MRMRFTKAERAMYAVGTAVEVPNGRYWYPAVVTGEVELYPGQVIQHIMCRITSTAGRKGTVHVGDSWGASPGRIRLPASN